MRVISILCTDLRRVDQVWVRNYRGCGRWKPERVGMHRHRRQHIVLIHRGDHALCDMMIGVLSIRQ